MVMDASVLRKLSEIKEIPTLPEIIQEVLTVLSSEESSAQDLGQILSTDQALCSKILKVANSAYFAQRRRISTTDEAVVILGFDAVAQLMLATSVFTVFSSMRPKCRFDVYGFWKHAIATAMAARMIAQRIADPPKEKVAYTAGLLHDIGKLVLVSHFPDSYAPVLDSIESGDAFLHEAELEILGYTHCDVGRWICDRWNFPEQLVHSIAMHHNESRSLRNTDPGPHIIRLADIITNRLQLGSSGNTKPFELKATEYTRIGLNQDAAAAVEQELESGRGEIDVILKAIN